MKPLFSWDNPSLLNQGRGKNFFATPAPLPYHFDMVMDKKRVEGFKKAFEIVLEKNDNVLEIGAGTGILSLLAKPYCRKVTAIEMASTVSFYGKRFIMNNSKGDIHYKTGDVRNFSFAEKFDAIICEIMDTGLFSEAQLGITNYAVEKLLKKNGKMIPFGARTSAQLVFVDFSIENLGPFPLPFYETSKSRIKAQTLSEPMIFHEVCFGKINNPRVKKRLEIKPIESGTANGLRFITDTLVTKDLTIEPTDWLNPWLVIPLEELTVKKGASIKVKVDFMAGEGISKVLISASSCP